MYDKNDIVNAHKNKPLVIDGIPTGLTIENGLAIYFLMRGGLEETFTISRVLDLGESLLSKRLIKNVFLHFDNTPNILRVSPRKLPPVVSRCFLHCRQCGHRMNQVPCQCRGIHDWSLNEVSEPERFKNLNASFVEGGDRHWVNHGRAEKADATYHGY